MQDKAVAAIGRLALQKSGQAEPYQLYVENMFPGAGVNYDMLLAVFSFTTENEQLECHFMGVDTEKASETSYQKYVYRKGGSNGGDVTFTTKSGDLAKKLNTLAGNQIKKAIALCRVSDYQFDLGILLALQHRLTLEYDAILSALQDGYGLLDKKRQQASGLSFCFDYEGERRYLADFSIFQQQVLLHGTAGKSEKYNVVSQGTNQLCSVCLKQKPLLHGFASPFKYASVDKRGMVSGFFDQRNNWKNYPICSECSLDFEYGQKYVVQKLRKTFYGSSYYAIPKTIIPKDAGALETALKLITGLNFNQSEAGKEKRSEDRIMQEIGKEKNYFTLNLMFFEIADPKTQAIKIRLLLEEIVPSRFRLLFSTVPEILNRIPLYKNAYRFKNEPQNLIFSFGLLKLFYEDDFYGIVNDVFVGRPINRQTLYNRFMTVIRANYNKISFIDGVPQTSELIVLKAHFVLNYLVHLNLVFTNQTTTMLPKEEPIEEPEEKFGRAFDETKFRQFVTDNINFLDDNYKVGIFAVGVLVRLLLNIQKRELGSTPFEKKFKGYNLNPDTLKTVYLETMAKLTQYRKYGKRYESLSRIISEYFTLNSYRLPSLSNNELSFYFVAGMEMSYQFRIEESKTDDQPVSNN